MGLRRASVALCILGGALPATRALTPIACITDTLVKGLSLATKWDMTVNYGYKLCCEHEWAYTEINYFAMGGYWPEDRDRIHHNRVGCITSLEQVLGNNSEYQVKHNKCDIGCPSDYKEYKVSRGGLCGGGCGGCPRYWKRIDCDGNKNVPCGQYWSLYSCDKNENVLDDVSDDPDDPTDSPQEKKDQKKIIEVPLSQMKNKKNDPNDPRYNETPLPPKKTLRSENKAASVETEQEEIQSSSSEVARPQPTATPKPTTTTTTPKPTKAPTALTYLKLLLKLLRRRAGLADA